MTDDQPIAQPPATDNTKNMANITYILYLASILVGITALVGVIIAYVSRGDAPDWLKTHYTYMIHTFWKGLLFCIISAVLFFVIIGFFTMLATLVWWIVRCIKGLQQLGKNEAIENPTGWGF